ncbi:MAG: succinate--CoA ligase subunit alpha [Candidatus Ranarchaeia archaeon]
MTIFIDNKTKVLVQGITGHHGSYHALRMKEYGTNIVGGVSPSKGGTEVSGIPVFDTIENAVHETDANSAIIFVPAPFALDAVLESIESKLSPIVVITEHIPIQDEIFFTNLSRKKGIDIIGPNTPGIISPGQCKMGIMPSHIFSKGNIGIVSRSGTLTYEIASSLTQSGFGQSTAVGIGGDPIVGVGFIEVLKQFEEDKDTEAIVIVGEIGGSAEEKAANFIKKSIHKPVIGYIAGATAPIGKRMGHAGAIITGNRGTWKAKIEAFEKANITISKYPNDIVNLIKKIK